MEKPKKPKLENVIIILSVIFLAIIAGLCYIGILPVGGRNGTEQHSQSDTNSSQSIEQHGRIFLYGESHSEERILEKELQLWDGYYTDGIRDLFVELPYFTAEFLNIWIQSETDDILNEVYEDWNGTALYSPQAKAFYMKIKENYPDTIFHGTDVGHQYPTTGERFLNYLRENGKENSEQYTLTQEAIEQGKYYYEHSDGVYRENRMTQNFIREFDRLDGSDIMGIYGLAHTQMDGMDYTTNTVPCMANQLKEHYGELVSSEDLTSLAYKMEPLKTEIIQIGENAYQGFYFGKQDLSAIFPEYQYREYWQLENAYEDFKNQATTGNVLPYNNFPMAVEEKQVFVIDYMKTDGSVVREYYRSDGNSWNGSPVTEQFMIE